MGSLIDDDKAILNMEKLQYLYNTTNQFETEKELLDNKKHYTAETLDDKNIHFKNKRVILPIKPVEESVAADICLVENSTLNKYIVDGNSYNVDLFPAEQYTPIGVVVVPASHTDDGTARIISLAAMDYNNPDSGSTEGHTKIYWGGYGYNISVLNDKPVFPCISTDLNITAETQTIVEWSSLNNYTCYLPSDKYNDYPNPYDEGTFYHFGTTSDSRSHIGPSPYLTGGLKNIIYHSTANTGNVCADMDGKGNTEKILTVDNGNLTAWQTAETIQNIDDNEFIHPAAQCCWRYHTVGTNQGDWYLPSAGELGYLCARWKAINYSIQKIINFSIFPALELPGNLTHLWSSTESYTRYSSNRVVQLGLDNLSTYFYGDTKDFICYVRAFISV